MEKRNAYSALLAVCLLWACSKSDDNTIAAPEVVYDQELTATFYTGGNSDAPNTNWNGDKGSFGLQKSMIGLSIDPTTGVLLWNKLLPPGNHTIEVIAFNNVGKIIVPITIENPLVGKFKGDLFPALHLIGHTDFVLEFNFKEDGALIGFRQFKNEESEILGPFPFFGSWVADGNMVQGDFQYEEVDDPKPFGGSIVQTEQKVVLSGQYWPDSNCDICTTFELELVIEQ